MARESKRRRDERRFGRPERLADKAIHAEWFPPHWVIEHSSEMVGPWEAMVSDLKSRIATTTVIAAENVGEYLYAVTDKEEWDFTEDFPSCVPPFRHFLIELRRPSRVYSRGQVKPLENGFPDSWGWQCEVDSREEFASKLRDPELVRHQKSQLRWQYESLCKVVDHDAIHAALSSGDRKAGFERLGQAERTAVMLASVLREMESGSDLTTIALPADAGWFLKAELFIEANGSGSPGIVGPVVHYVFAMDARGKILGPPTMAFVGGHLPEFLARSQDFVNFTSAMLFPAMLAISFMNCKNVTMEHVEPDREINRERKKHGLKPFVRYHTINIEPMKKVLRTEGGVEANGLRRALHIVRGHFTHYTEDKPLFGRPGLHGTFWTPSHTKGSLKNGLVVSDYNVSPARTTDA